MKHQVQLESSKANENENKNDQSATLIIDGPHFSNNYNEYKSEQSSLHWSLDK